jgi:hypothetical protein
MRSLVEFSTGATTRMKPVKVIRRQKIDTSAPYRSDANAAADVRRS